MSDNQHLEQLKEMLGSPLINKRKAGIDMAREMLAKDLEWEQVRSLLEGVAKDDLITTVQKKAQQVLNEDKASRNPRNPNQADYVFRAKCSNGHVNDYDKRIYCPRKRTMMRDVKQKDGKDVDDVVIQCKTCDDEFVWALDCEGYK